MQNDFIYGPLGTSETRAIVPKIKKKIEEYSSRDDAVVFTRDRLFSQRFSPTGMSCSNKLGNISFHCFGENGLTANIFYGVDIDSSISKYRFEYCGVEYVCPVEKGTILDIFLDINEGFTNAHGIELLE
jgi:nicotinamidase-related amidase